MKTRHLLPLLLMLCMARAGNAQSTYLNPILGGDYPDPTVMREGNDYYMTHSAFDYLPGLVVFHSKDLVNWEPISYALKTYLGSIWAPDIKKYKGKYYIYFTVHGKPNTNCVVWADSPYGPWSDPTDLKIGDIDPCHVVGEDGKRYLVMSGGNRWTLSDDGLSVVQGSRIHFYDGWPYPEEWVTEGFSLEGPKVYRIGNYFYYLSAQGGTAGPPTSHMVTVARSKSINGPWENMPTNPLIHTYHNSDRWWSRGHGSLIDTPDGKWYCIYHAYENSFTSIGRQTLMDPVHFTADQWIKADGGDASQPLPAPFARQTKVDRHGHLSDFRIGLDWKYYMAFDPARATAANGSLTLQGKGKTISESSPLMFVSGAHRYQIEAEIEIHGDVQAGLVFHYKAGFNAGTGFDRQQRYRYRRDAASRRGPSGGERLWLRLVNTDQVVTAWYSTDGKQWRPEQWGQEISGYNHNALYDFQSILPGIFCIGNGYAVFRNFKYTEF
ncbi:MAG: family 43 glycosylhydrolase [Prevotella sp.]|nr:family 43 glycosylhydrolase [Prevotella sp.]MDY4038932.1 family 43 glycosylhydrolase [Prevotella sp.]